jgi:hypothetical protein
MNSVTREFPANEVEKIYPFENHLIDMSYQELASAVQEGQKLEIEENQTTSLDNYQTKLYLNGKLIAVIEGY